MPDETALLVDWANAHTVIAAQAEARRRGRAVVVIGVTGPVGAGKSTLANRLGGVVVSTDSYLPDYDRLPREHWDDPANADLDLLARHLEELRSGRAAAIPVWSFHSHSREGYRELHAAGAGIVVCEGLHALDTRVRHRLDLAVYVDAPSAIRWQRCESREAEGQRGWGVDAARTFFHQVAEPTYSGLSDQYRRAADVLVVNGGPS